jgi:hypothetical protein
MYFNEANQQLFFDPNKHPEDTLKAFQEFIQTFELRYNAQYPDPPRVSLDAAVERRKVANTTEATPHPKPTLDQYDVVPVWECTHRSDFIRIGKWQSQMNLLESRKHGQSL